MNVIFAAELAVLCIGSWLFLRARGHTNSEAAACGISGTFVILAAIYQAASSLGRPNLSLWVEGAAVIGAIVQITRRHRLALSGLAGVLQTLRRHPAAGAGLFFGLAYLAIQGIVIPTDPGHWDALGRMLMLQHHPVWDIGAPSPRLLELPENHSILAHLFIRNRSDIGLGLLGLAAYTAIGFATYALSRRYAWPPAAMTVTLIAVSCPRFILGASGPGIALIPAAVGAAAILSLYRLVEYPNRLDLTFFMLFTGFLCGDQTLWLGFPCILLLLGGVLLFRRHGVQIWVKMISGRPWKALFVGCAALFLSRIWLILFNGLFFGRWEMSHRFSSLPLNADGIQGAMANAARYVLQAAEIPSALDRVIYWISRVSISDTLDHIYTSLIYPLFGSKGASAIFQIPIGSGEQTAWFGPLCLLLLPVAFLYGLRFAPRRLKAVLVALIGYGFLIALVAAWLPDNGRLFGVLYACSIFSISFFLPPWRLTLNSRRLLRWASFMLFFYTCLFNADRPALDISHSIAAKGRLDLESANAAVRFRGYLLESFQNGIWVQSAWGGNRWMLSRKFFGDQRVDQIAGRVPSSQRLIVLYAEPAAAFPFLMLYPRAEAYPIASLDAKRWSSMCDMQPDGILFVDQRPPDGIDTRNWPVIWQADPVFSNRSGVLFYKPLLYSSLNRANGL